MIDKNETTGNGRKELVKEDNILSVKYLLENAEKMRLTNLKEKPSAPSYIRPHTVKGKSYYYYCQGNKEIYLGTAESILKKVKMPEYIVRLKYEKDLLPGANKILPVDVPGICPWCADPLIEGGEGKGENGLIPF